MYPALRGGNNSPGYRECDYGEVDDVIAAGKYLATLPNVDPNRIYLGGHSTGGTLVLLTAESTNEFRAVFALGGKDAYSKFGHYTFDNSNKKELFLRAPLLFMKAVTVPTFIMEGANRPANTESLNFLANHNTNPKIQCYEFPGYDHYSELAMSTPIIAQKIVQDTGPTANISFADQPKFVTPSP